MYNVGKRDPLPESFCPIHHKRFGRRSRKKRCSVAVRRHGSTLCSSARRCCSGQVTGCYDQVSRSTFCSNIGKETFAPWKVVWPWVASQLVAAVVGADSTEKTVVQDHNVSLVAFSSVEEAHFFCAAFNSSPANCTAISSYSSGGGGIASPNIVERIRVPRFDSANPVHRQLSTFSQRAHELAPAAPAAMRRLRPNCGRSRPRWTSPRRSCGA